MKKIFALITILISVNCYSNNKLPTYHDYIVIKFKISLVPECFIEPVYINLFTNKNYRLQQDSNSYFWMTVKKEYFSKRKSRFEIGFMGYRILNIKNIPLNYDTIDLGSIPLFEESTGDLIALDYMRSSWFSIIKWRSRKYYKEFKLNEPDYEIKREKMNQEISNYKYLFNGKLYKIDAENDLLDLK